MRAVLTAQKFVPSIKETTKDGSKETRQLVLKGQFAIFIKGQPTPIKLPVKLEFKDTPTTVQLVQSALNIEDTGEECLLVVFSNRNQRLDAFVEELKSLETDQQLKFGPQDTKDEEEE